MGTITKNWSYHEFRPEGAPKIWKPSSLYRKLLLDNLARNLQVISNNLPEYVTLKVSGGVRGLMDYGRLIKAGYQPSETSDHYCGTSVPLIYGSEKYNKYGETYNFAIGAADIQSIGIPIWQLFSLSFKLSKEGKCDFGQIIYEHNPKTDAEWVHYGGSLKNIFSNSIISFIGRKKYMKSLDGGRTYSVVENI